MKGKVDETNRLNGFKGRDKTFVMGRVAIPPQFDLKI